MGKPDDSGIAFVRSFLGFQPLPWSLPAVAGCGPRPGAPHGRVGERHRGWGKMSSCLNSEKPRSSAFVRLRRDKATTATTIRVVETVEAVNC
jgi:hypothetical protein